MREQVIRRIVAALHNNVRYTGVEFGSRIWSRNIRPRR